MDRSYLVSAALIPNVPAGGWNIVGVGDFDGKSKSDIIWCDDNTGQNYISIMDGTTVRFPLSNFTSTVATNWSVVNTR